MNILHYLFKGMCNKPVNYEINKLRIHTLFNNKYKIKYTIFNTIWIFFMKHSMEIINYYKLLKY
jgi:hypothetical protein